MQELAVTFLGALVLVLVCAVLLRRTLHERFHAESDEDAEARRAAAADEPVPRPTRGCYREP